MEFFKAKKNRNEMPSLSIPVDSFFTGVPHKEGKLIGGVPENPALYYRIGTLIVRFDGCEPLSVNSATTILGYQSVNVRIKVVEGDELPHS
jgi:hypothetical protein